LHFDKEAAMAPDPKVQNERELQPDPLMKEGRSSKAWFWVVGIIILAAIVVTFIAIDRNNSQSHGVQQNAGNANYVAGASNKPPPVTVPAGRGTSNSPKEGNYHTVR
jgi:hypothetical protein